MTKKKKKAVPAAAAAAPDGDELAMSNLSDEGPIRHLKTLNGRLVKETAEHRELINQLRSEHDAMAADHNITEGIERDVFGVFLSSNLASSVALVGAELRRADAHLAAERAAAAEMIGNLVKKDESSAEKSKELVERLRSMEQTHALMSTEREVAEAEGRKLEEEKMENLLQSSMNQLVLESFLEEKKYLAEKYVRELEEVKSQMESAENRVNASKEINDRLESEVCDLKSCLENQKKENLALVVRTQIDFGRLEKEKLGLEKALTIKEKEMALQINELKGNVAKMAEENKLLKQRRAKYDIQIFDLQREMSELQYVNKSLEDDNISWSERSSIKEAENAALQRELNLKTVEAAGLKSEIEELIKDKHGLVLKCKELRANLNEMIIENGNMKTSLTEKASLEKQLKISQKGLQDIEKKLMDLENSHGSILALLRKTTAEVGGQIGDDDEGIHSFVNYLDTIKHANNNKETMIQDMIHKLELMKLQNNKGVIRKWLFPTTTVIFGVITLAYVAKAH